MIWISEWLTFRLAFTTETDSTTGVPQDEQIVATIGYVFTSHNAEENRQVEMVCDCLQDSATADIGLRIAVLPIESSFLAHFTELLLGF
jgi:hypothetical protein